MSFANRHVVITGGTEEIGLAVVAAFASHGAEVTLFERVLPTGAVASTVETLGALSPDGRY